MMINYCCQISLGMLFHDENTTDGITKVIEHLHQYLDKNGEGENAKFVEEGLVSDQLTIERAINAAQSRKNGLNAEQRLEGFHWGVADWHTGVKLCSVSLFIHYDRLFSENQFLVHDN